jgi:hypothetical protein
VNGSKITHKKKQTLRTAVVLMMMMRFVFIRFDRFIHSKPKSGVYVCVNNEANKMRDKSKQQTKITHRRYDVKRSKTTYPFKCQLKKKKALSSYQQQDRSTTTTTTRRKVESINSIII